MTKSCSRCGQSMFDACGVCPACGAASAGGSPAAAARTSRKKFWDSWKGYTVFGFLVFPIGTFAIYDDFCKFENGEEVSMPELVWLLYRLGGKWLPVALFSAMAIGTMLLAVREYRRYRAS